MPGRKSLEEVDRFAYTSLKQKYRDEGDDIFWTMKDGTPIKIKNMDDRHVKNTANMLRRKPYNGSREAWIEILESEQLRRRFMKINKLKDNIDSDDL